METNAARRESQILPAVVAICIAPILFGIAHADPATRSSQKSKKSPALPPAPVVDYQGQIDALKSQVTALQNQLNQFQAQMAQSAALSKHVALQTVDGKPTVVISAANLQVNNGLGRTDTINGTGNIIIGYDEKRAPWGSLQFCSLGSAEQALYRKVNGDYFNPRITTEASCIAAGGTYAVDNKSGSHYLIVGPGHFYSSYSGIVAGWWNLSNARYANVTGGGFNQANGFGSTVVGGRENWAFGGTAGCRTPEGPTPCWPGGTGNPYGLVGFKTISPNIPSDP